MTDKELKELGIIIHEDGTGLREYREYSFDGVKLPLFGNNKKIKLKELFEAIYQAGQNRVRIRIKELLQISEPKYENHEY